MNESIRTDQAGSDLANEADGRMKPNRRIVVQAAGGIVALSLAWPWATNARRLEQRADAATPVPPDGFFVPSTISPEAQAYLAQNYSRTARDAESLPAPDDLAAWSREQMAIETEALRDAAPAVAEYAPSIAEATLGGVPVLDVRPRGWVESTRVVVYLHGGAYAFYSARSTLNASAPLAGDSGLRVVSIDYTLAPLATWREITEQAAAVVRALLAAGHAMSELAVFGDSAGGGLAAAVVLKLRDEGLGLPAALLLWSPWADVTETGDTYATLAAADPSIVYPRVLARCAAAYADPADQTNPLVSPVYGDFGPGFPPTLIQAGTKEILLSGAVRLYRAIDGASGMVTLDVWEGMWHDFPAYPYHLPESRRARRKGAAFLRSHLRV